MSGITCMICSCEGHSNLHPGLARGDRDLFWSILVVYIVRLKKPRKMRRWSLLLKLIVSGRFQGQQRQPWYEVVIDREAPPTHFHGHFKAHNIYYLYLMSTLQIPYSWSISYFLTPFLNLKWLISDSKSSISNKNISFVLSVIFVSGDSTFAMTHFDFRK